MPIAIPLVLVARLGRQLAASRLDTHMCIHVIIWVYERQRLRDADSRREGSSRGFRAGVPSAKSRGSSCVTRVHANVR